MHRIKLIILLLLLFLMVGCQGEVEKTDSNSHSDVPLVQEEHEASQGIRMTLEEGIYWLRGAELHQESLLALVENGIQVVTPMGQVYGFQWEGQEPQITSLEGMEKVLPASKGVFLLVKEGESYSLYHQLPGERRLITQGIPFEGLKYLILKEDGSRLAYANGQENQLLVYTVANGKKVVIDQCPLGELADPVEESIFFSPQGGYLTLLLKTAEYEGFVSYGADSGRKIHEMLYGLYPQWSYGEEAIAFLNQTPGQISEGVTVGDQVLNTSDKISIYQLKTRNIKVWDEVTLPIKIIGPPLWSMDDNYLIYHTGEGDPSTTKLLNLKESTIRHIQETALNQGEDGILQGSDGKWLVYLTEDATGKKVLEGIGITGEGSLSYGEVMAFPYRTSSDIHSRWVLYLETGLYYVKDQSLYVVDGDGSRCIFKNQQKILWMQYLKEGAKVALMLEGEAGNTIALIPVS